MAAYGVFLAACGFEYHGPKGHIGFAPRVTPENFKAPFTTAEGWGTFSQQQKKPFSATLAVRWGKLRLRTIALSLPPGIAGLKARVTLGTTRLNAVAEIKGQRLCLTLPGGVVIDAGHELKVSIP